MAWLWIAMIALVTLFNVAERRRGGLPAFRVHGPDTLQVAIWCLLGLMDPDTSLVLENVSGHGFLQFVLIAQEDLARTVEFTVPAVEWSQPFFLAMQQALEAAAFRPAIQHDSKRRWVAPVLRLRLEGSPGALAQQMEWIVFQAVRTLGWEGPQFTARFFGKFAPGGEQRWREATRPAK